MEYVKMAHGETSFFFHEYSLPWDHAAGVLIVEEAGGKAAFLDGSSYFPRIADRSMLAASSSMVWDDLRGVLLP